MRDNKFNARVPRLAAPTIGAVQGHVVTGAGFLPEHDVTIRITYLEQDVCDNLTYSTDNLGRLYAVIPSGLVDGAYDIAVTDHRADPNAADGMLWSNTRSLRDERPRDHESNQNDVSGLGRSK